MTATAPAKWTRSWPAPDVEGPFAIDPRLRYYIAINEAARWARIAGVTARDAMDEIARAIDVDLDHAAAMEDPAICAFYVAIGREKRP